jgi:hypothetical protein
MGFRVNMVSVCTCMWSFRRGHIIWPKELDPNLNISVVQKEEKIFALYFLSTSGLHTVLNIFIPVFKMYLSFCMVRI